MSGILLQIRPSDHDSLGHVNNASYVALVQQAVAKFLARHGFSADWRQDGPYQWMMQDLAIEYRSASSFGDRVTAHVWLDEADESQPVLGCQLCRADDEQPVVIRARSRWQRREASTGKATKLPATFLEVVEAQSGDLPRPFQLPPATEEVRRYRWRHTVRRNEVGPGGWIHPHVLFEWIEQSILDASSEAGWPIEHCLAEDFVVLQMRHDARFASWPVLGDRVEVISRLVNARRLRGTWHNELRNADDDRPLAIDYSTGIFLNLDGRPTSPPAGMIEALQGSNS